MYDAIKRGQSLQGVESAQLDRSKLTLERTEHVFRCVQFEGVCAPVWWVCHCMVGCTLVWEVAPVWEDVSQCGRVCLTVGKCVPVWDGVPVW